MVPKQLLLLSNKKFPIAYLTGNPSWYFAKQRISHAKPTHHSHDRLQLSWIVQNQYIAYNHHNIQGNNFVPIALRHW